MKYLIKKNLRRLGNVGETIDLTPLAAEKYLANNAITEYKEDDTLAFCNVPLGYRYSRPPAGATAERFGVCHCDPR